MKHLVIFLLTGFFLLAHSLGEQILEKDVFASLAFAEAKKEETKDKEGENKDKKEEKKTEKDEKPAEDKSKEAAAKEGEAKTAEGEKKEGEGAAKVEEAPKGPSQEEVSDMLKAIEEKKKALEAENERLKSENKRLESLKQEIEDKTDELTKIRQDVEGSIKNLDSKKSAEELAREAAAKAEEETKLKQLVKAYAAMKPKSAGALMDKLDTEVAKKVILRMNGAVAGKILSYVNPEKAAAISEAVAAQNGGSKSSGNKPADANNSGAK